MKWEYFVVDLFIQRAAERMHSFNDLGEEGWELVGIASDKAYFKRPSTKKKSIKREFSSFQAVVSDEGKASYLIGKDEEESE